MTVNLFNERAFSEVVAQLGNLGYRNGLLEKGYKFPDWFGNKKERVATAVAFGQTPSSYETACIGVISPNGSRASSLVDDYRALGAPILLEVDNNEVRAWEVSRKAGGHALLESVSFDQIKQLFVDRAPYWKPNELLRAKNIGAYHGTQQLTLFSGLLPELEDRVQQSLEPLLHRALSATKQVYKKQTGRDPNSRHLFKLIFWLLTAKVFYDRQVTGFVSLRTNADEILAAISRKYKEDTQGLLTKQARDTAAEHIWSDLDFRNLSVEVLSQMWSTMLIDKDTKKRLGIQRTSRTIVQYIIEKLQPFQQSGDDQRIIFEPCSGSAGFLVGAMNALRPNLFLMAPEARHRYFTKHLVGVEKDPFGVEISRLALTLADFPNLGGWQIKDDDVFRDGSLKHYLQRAGVVLCNPPFRPFDPNEKTEYNYRSSAKPVELLHRVLDDLHPSGVLGFVLPRNIVDGKAYKDIRKRLSERFAAIDLTVLPDRAFEASVEVGLLVATEPIPHNTSRVIFAKVNDNAAEWRRFEFGHELSYEQAIRQTPEESEESFGIPPLGDLWKYLNHHKTINDIAEIHRGLEWNVAINKAGKETGNRSWLVRTEPSPGYILGVAPLTKFNVFEVPELLYLNREKKYQRRNAYAYSWEKPKVILGKTPRSRGPWRLAVFSDNKGIACAQSFYGVWPTSTCDEIALAAILNSPLANAFVATREGKQNITKDILKRIPVPKLTESQETELRNLVKKYQEAINPFFLRNSNEDAENILKQIDALVLDGYNLPPRLEHQLLKFFEGHNSERQTSHEFTDYLPPDYESYFSLSTHLSPKFQRATAGAMREYFGIT
jgi:N-6 DNA Methylase